MNSQLQAAQFKPRQLQKGEKKQGQFSGSGTNSMSSFAQGKPEQQRMPTSVGGRPGATTGFGATPEGEYEQQLGGHLPKSNTRSTKFNQKPSLQNASGTDSTSQLHLQNNDAMGQRRQTGMPNKNHHKQMSLKFTGKVSTGLNVNNSNSFAQPTQVPFFLTTSSSGAKRDPGFSLLQKHTSNVSASSRRSGSNTGGGNKGSGTPQGAFQLGNQGLANSLRSKQGSQTQRSKAGFKSSQTGQRITSQGIAQNPGVAKMQGIGPQRMASKNPQSIDNQLLQVPAHNIGVGQATKLKMGNTRENRASSTKNLGTIGHHDYPSGLAGTLGPSQFYQKDHHEERFFSDEGIGLQNMGGRHFNNSMLSGNLVNNPNRMSPKNMQHHPKAVMSPGAEAKWQKNQTMKPYTAVQDDPRMIRRVNDPISPVRGMNAVNSSMPPMQPMQAVQPMQQPMEIEAEETIPVVIDLEKNHIFNVLENLMKLSSMDVNWEEIVNDTVNDQAIRQTELNIKNQRTIKADAERTRISEMKALGLYTGQPINKSQEQENVEDEQDSFKNLIADIESLLTYYTVASGTSYKQGYNELVAPFLWLALKTKKEIDSLSEEIKATLPEGYEMMLENPLTLSFHALDMFVKVYIPTLFLDDDFVCLQSCFCLMRLLLKYHDPYISLILQRYSVTPELYGTAWFFTYFSRKCEKVEIALEFWNRVMEMSLGDRTFTKFIFPFSVALILDNSQFIMNSEATDLLEHMASLQITSGNQLVRLIERGQILMLSTPVSFWDSDEMSWIFGENSAKFYSQISKEQKMEIHSSLETMQCLPVAMSEFFNFVYPEDITCPNPNCLRFDMIVAEIAAEKRREQSMTKLKDEMERKKQYVPTGILFGGPDEDSLRILNHSSMISSSSEATASQSQSTLGPKQLPLQGTSKLAKQQQKSPFKTMVKQQPIEADASVVPMETETNIKEDEGEVHGKVQHNSLIPEGEEEGSPLVDLTALINNGEQSLEKYFSNLGVDVTDISMETVFPFGPTVARLCQYCKQARQRNVDGVPASNGLRLVVKDCRVDMLQQECLLPRSSNFNFGATCRKGHLLDQVLTLQKDCKNKEHICLLGLSALQSQNDLNNSMIQDLYLDQSPVHSQSNLPIREFHEKVLRMVTEMFYFQKFKYVSYLPGGFEACHAFIKQFNAFKLRTAPPEVLPRFLEFTDHHERQNCFHCIRTQDSWVPMNTSLQPQRNFPTSSGQSYRDSTFQQHQVRRQVSGDYVLVDDYPNNEFTQILNKSQNLATQRTAAPSKMDQPIYGHMSHRNKYDQLNYQIVSEDNAMNSNAETEGFSIFSGFRNWFQDNINPKLKDLGIIEDDIPGKQDQFGNNQNLVIRSESGEQIQLMNVTQQTRQQLQMRPREEDPRVPPQHYQHPGFAPPPNRGEIGMGFNQDNRGVQHYGNFHHENLSGPNYPSEAAPVHGFGHHQQRHQQQFAGHQPGQQQQMRNKYFEQTDLNIISQNRESINKTVQASTFSGFHPPRQQDNPSPGIIQKRRADPTEFHQQPFMPQQQLPGHLQKDDQGFDHQNPRTFAPNKEEAELHFDKDSFPQEAPSSHQLQQQHQQQHQLHQQQAAAMARLEFNQKRKQIRGSFKGGEERQSATIGGFQQQKLTSRSGREDIIEGELENSVAPQQLEIKDGSSQFMQRNKAQAFGANEEAREVTGGSEAGAQIESAPTEERKDDASSRADTTMQPQARQQTEDTVRLPSELDQQQQQQNDSRIGNSMTTAASSEFMLEERSHYMCNGILTHQSYVPQMELVKHIIEVEGPGNPEDIIVYHLKRLASSHLQQMIQQQQLQRVDQSEGQIQVFGIPSKNPSITTIIITQYTIICLCQAQAKIHSRFFMHDLIKITSRKSSAKIITFYFRIPKFIEYTDNFYNNLEAQEQIILDSYNREPHIEYQFAYKRKKYNEVKMGFEFENEEDAKTCIQRVSILYKRLKDRKGGGDKPSQQ